MANRNITKAQAVRVQKAVTAFMGDQPFLYRPGFHASGWTLALEGDYDWPHRIAEAAHTGDITIPKGVFIEPVNGWALGLYPA